MGPMPNISLIVVGNLAEDRTKKVQLLFEENYEKFRLRAAYYLRSMDAAHDIVVDAFLDALSIWPTEKFESILDLKKFLSTTIKNRSLNALRQRKRFVEMTFDPSDPKTPRINPIDMTQLDLNVLLKKLPDDQAKAFALRLDGYSHEEIMEKMGLTSVGSSKNLVYRAKKKLRDILLNEFPFTDPDDDGGGGGALLVFERKYAKGLGVSYEHNPSFVDMLDYVEGRLHPGSERYARLIQWVILDDFGFDAVSALRRALKEHSTDTVLFFLKKGKDDLRQLLSASALALYSNPRFNTLKH